MDFSSFCFCIFYELPGLGASCHPGGQRGANMWLPPSSASTSPHPTASGFTRRTRLPLLASGLSSLFPSSPCNPSCSPREAWWTFSTKHTVLSVNEITANHLHVTASSWKATGQSWPCVTSPEGLRHAACVMAMLRVLRHIDVTIITYATESPVKIFQNKIIPVCLEWLRNSSWTCEKTCITFDDHLPSFNYLSSKRHSCTVFVPGTERRTGDNSGTVSFFQEPVVP